MWKHVDYGSHSDVQRQVQQLQDKITICLGALDSVSADQQLASIISMEQLTSLEKLYTNLVYLQTKTSVSLSSASHVPSLTGATDQAQRSILECAQAWQQIYKLNNCLSIHTHHCSSYHQFLIEACYYKQWLHADVTKALDALKSLTPLHAPITNDKLQYYITLLRNLIGVHKKWRKKIKELTYKAPSIIPIYLRNETTNEPLRATCIEDYRSIDVYIQKNEEVKLVDKSDLHEWKIQRLNDSHPHNVPSIFFIINGPCLEVDVAIDNLVGFYEGEWTRSAIIACLYVVRLLNRALHGFNLDQETISVGKWRTKQHEIINLISTIENIFGAKWWEQNHKCITNLKNKLCFIRKALTEDNNTRANRSFHEWGSPVEGDESELFFSESETINGVFLSLEEFFRISKPRNSLEFELDFDKINCEDYKEHDDCDVLAIECHKDEVYEVMTDKQVAQLSNVTTSQQEHNHTFVITGVLDPESKAEISFDEAIKKGVINKTKGIYVRGDGLEDIDVQKAMNEGLIKVEMVKTKKMKEIKSNIGLITIKSFTESRPFTIESVIDASTNNKLNLDQAVSQNIIDLEKKVYHNRKSNVNISFSEALENGFLAVKFFSKEKNTEVLSDSEENEQNSPNVVTYMVFEVKDTYSGEFVPFQKASYLKIINPDTGLFFDRANRNHLKLSEAIEKGFVKGSKVNDLKSIDLSSL